MRGAQELANDLHHALELVENERDEAVRERDEAQAVIDAVRRVRDVAVRSIHQDEESATLASNEVIRSRWLSRRDTWGKVVALLNEVDGL